LTHASINFRDPKTLPSWIWSKLLIFDGRDYLVSGRWWDWTIVSWRRHLPFIPKDLIFFFFFTYQVATGRWVTLPIPLLSRWALFTVHCVQFWIFRILFSTCLKFFFSPDISSFEYLQILNLLKLFLRCGNPHWVGRLFAAHRFWDSTSPHQPGCDFLNISFLNWGGGDFAFNDWYHYFKWSGFWQKRRLSHEMIWTVKVGDSGQIYKPLVASWFFNLLSYSSQ
jgi:hypothetical protein